MPADRERSGVRGFRVAAGPEAVPKLLPIELRGHQQDAPFLPREGLCYGGKGAVELSSECTVQVRVRVLLQVGPVVDEGMAQGAVAYLTSSRNKELNSRYI